MHKNGTHCFAVIYIPFYALQCARQKCALEKSVLDHRRSDQLTFDVVEADTPRVGEPRTNDDASSDFPAALLDQEGMRVIELNHVAEDLGSSGVR